jgi:predicted nucleotidyltransferase component of viral defense system
MKAWLSLPENTRKNIFNQISAREGLPAGAVEKDWWVTTALRIVFSLPFASSLVFKGGTSLSKGWNLIERFSEDIDLAIDREYLGFKGDLSKTQIRKLKKKACSFISQEFTEEIKAKAQALGIPDLLIQTQEFQDSDTDPLIVELYYKSLTDDSPYLRPRVLIEIGARSLIEPSEKRDVQSMVDVYFQDKNFAEPPLDIPIVLPRRTFLEKAFLLHEEFQKPLENIRVERLSRHLYDLDKLMDTYHAEDALADTELYQAIIAHRERFTPVKGVVYSTHQPDKIDFVPPQEVIKRWEADYSAMQESMIYGESKNFKALITNIEKLRERFRNIKLNPTE